ncbi:MAG: hypothetical protein AAFV30_10350, partial [Pseudomonadota bacterium]
MRISLTMPKWRAQTGQAIPAASVSPRTTGEAAQSGQVKKTKNLDIIEPHQGSCRAAQHFQRGLSL